MRRLVLGTRFLSSLCALLVVMVLLQACGSGDKEQTPPEQVAAEAEIAVDDLLRVRLAEYGAKPRIKGKFAFHVYDLTADKPVYGYDETLAQPSASCLKLLSGVAGLHLLGTDYTYVTSLYKRGHVSAGTLQGDLIFKAGLDPQLNEAELARFAQAAKGAGIREVAGKMYVDLVLKEPVKSEEHWYPWDLAFSRYGLLYKGGGAHHEKSQVCLS